MAKTPPSPTRTSSGDASTGFADPAVLGSAMSDWPAQWQRMQSDALTGWQQALSAQSRLAGGWIELQSELARGAQQQAQALVDAWWGAIPAMQAAEPRPPVSVPAEPGTPAAMVEQARALWDGLVCQWTGGVPLDG
ncbi:MAG TPA: hypothetical protein VF169_14935 [Albitalea sp.]|uniref:hypothetical protein n=1 Tax=Piscinibacter sp. TaxID=1903157 RepID=UPI002ED6535B